MEINSQHRQNNGQAYPPAYGTGGIGGRRLVGVSRGEDPRKIYNKRWEKKNRNVPISTKKEKGGKGLRSSERGGGPSRAITVPAVNLKGRVELALSSIMA